MIQDIKDRVPVNVLSNDAIRYGIYDEQGNLVRYEYIKREDEPAVIGTPINKALFNNFQGDLYAVDRYNKPTITKGQVSPDGVKVIGNAFPNDWTRVSSTEYTASNGDILTASGSAESTSSYRLNYAVDGVVNTSKYWQSSPLSTTGENKQWIKMKLNNPLNIKKMATYISATTSYFAFTSAIIQGSNDDEKWDDLCTISSVQNSLTEITLDNNNYYQYYRIYLTGTTTSANNGTFLVYEWQTVEYMTKEEQLINNINVPLTSYEVGKIVNIECNSVYSENILLKENFFDQKLFETNNTNGVFADGTIVELGDNVTSESLKNIFDNSTSTYVSLSTQTTGTIKIILPYPKKITEMYIYISPNNSFKIKGSKNNEDWVELYSQATSSSLAFQPKLNNADFYKYYMLEITPPSDGAAILYQWKTIEYYGGMVKTFQNPYLNINNLGAKQINGIIEAGAKYRLVYNGESWDIYPAMIIKRGEYTGNSDGNVNVDLGGRAKVVFVYATSNSTIQMCVANDGLNPYNLDYTTSNNNVYYAARKSGNNFGSITITDTGFTATSTNGSSATAVQGFAYKSNVYGYIAIL